MTRERKHIDQVLKEKLSGQKLPVTEADWEAFRTFRTSRDGEKKKPRTLFMLLKEKLDGQRSPVAESEWHLFRSRYAAVKAARSRRFYLGISALVLLLALTGTVIWLSNPGSAPNPSETGMDTPTKQPQATPEHNPVNPGEADGKTGQTNGQAEQAPEIPATPGKGQQPDRETTGEIASGNGANGTPGNRNPGDPGKKSEDPAPASGFTRYINPVPAGIQAFRLPFTGRPDLELVYPGMLTPPDKDGTTTKDTKQDKKELRREKNLQGKGPSLALGFMYGIGNPNLQNVGTGYQVHEQYAEVIRNTPTRSTVKRLYLRYEHRWRWGLDFGAALEYSSSLQTQQLNFQRRSLPFYDLDGRTVLGYIPIPDSMRTTTAFHSQQSFFAFRLPISVGYSRFVSEKLMLGGRLSYALGYRWSGENYQGIDPETLLTANLKSKANPLSMLYGAGIYAEYFYLTNYSVRASIDASVGNLQYRNNNYNLTNRFYEFNLAMIWYLK